MHAAACFDDRKIRCLQIERRANAKPWAGNDAAQLRRVADWRGRHGCGRCRCGRDMFEIANRLDDRRDSGGGSRFESDDDDFVATANAEGHQRHRAASAGAAAASAQFDFVGQAFGDARDLRCRPRVDAVGVVHHHGFADHDCA